MGFIGGPTKKVDFFAGSYSKPLIYRMYRDPTKIDVFVGSYSKPLIYRMYREPAKESRPFFVGSYFKPLIWDLSGALQKIGSGGFGRHSEKPEDPRSKPQSPQGKP